MGPGSHYPARHPLPDGAIQSPTAIILKHEPRYEWHLGLLLSTYVSQLPAVNAATRSAVESLMTLVMHVSHKEEQTYNVVSNDSES
jgi:hypothetical protein